MSNPIFRQKSIEKISSPEQMNDYIRVSNPSVRSDLKTNCPQLCVEFVISQINESVYALVRNCLQPPYSYTCAESYLLHVIEDYFCFYLLQDRNMSDCRLPNFVRSNPDNLRRDQMCL